jgi:hypothetical protein
MTRAERWGAAEPTRIPRGTQRFLRVEGDRLRDIADEGRT